MSFTDFFQQNIIIFIAGFALLAYLLFIELRGLNTRGQTLTPTQLTQQVNAGAKLIDLRRPDDYRAGHIAGAKNIQSDEFTQHITSLGKKDKAIILYCYKGIGSKKALAELQKSGFTNVSHLAGGIETWKHENLPTAST
ncbi:MAG: rhodanese-like domain-containing protein [Ostreibacterium sp.]